MNIYIYKPDYFIERLFIDQNFFNKMSSTLTDAIFIQKKKMNTFHI